MQIAGHQKTSLIEYPGKIATVIFTYGCNFRCPFCHNPELVIKKFDPQSAITEKEFFSFLKKRKSVLEAVVITGGEPLLHTDIKDFITKIKKFGLLVKVDTNGSLPQKILDLINFVDYFAMDIKNSSALYSSTTNTGVNMEAIKQSIKIIKEKAKDYEFRTTFVPGLHTFESAQGIGELIKGAKRFFIQNFRKGKTIDKSYVRSKSFSQEALMEFKAILSKYIKEVKLRGF